jgi:hypothetical protein
LQFDRVFPDDFYAPMLEAMPVAEEYRAMSGKSKKGSGKVDGKPTRTKIDLFPEYIRHLPPKNRNLWDIAGHALRSQELAKAFVQRLAPGLKRRFGNNFANVKMYPVPFSLAIFRDTGSLNTPTASGRESQSSFICLPTTRRHTSGQFSTKSFQTAENPKKRRCHSHRTAAMRLR